MPAPAIEVKNLVKRYPSAIAVDGISFTVARGVIAALLGGNGAGKTTTLSILLGLLLPTAGTVHVLGEDILRHRYRVLAADEFFLAVCRPAASADRAPEPVDLCPALRFAPAARADRDAGRGFADRRLSRPAGGQIVGRAEDPRRARQGAAERARAVAARRADRLARPRHRRLGAQLSRSLAGAHRRDDPDGLAQHGRGRADVLGRADDEGREDRRPRQPAGADRALRPRQSRRGVSAHRPQPEPELEPVS